MILSVTYVVVLFSIIIQGLTVKRLVECGALVITPILALTTFRRDGLVSA